MAVFNLTFYFIFPQFWFQTDKPGHEIAVINEQGGSQNIKEPLPCNGENKPPPLITAKQYACRNALLSSLVVAWSPAVPSCDTTSCLSRNWCILAVGSKSGVVSFWKIYKPEYYTVDACMVTRDPILIGVLQAHNSWVSAISWEVSSAGSLKSSLLLATGCSDGRWAQLFLFVVNGYALSLYNFLFV